MLPEEPGAKRDNGQNLNNVFADNQHYDQEAFAAAIKETSGCQNEPQQRKIRFEDCPMIVHEGQPPNLGNGLRQRRRDLLFSFRYGGHLDHDLLTHRDGDHVR